MAIYRPPVAGEVRAYLGRGLAARDAGFRWFSSNPNPRPVDGRWGLCSQIETRDVERVETETLLRLVVIDPDERRGELSASLALALIEVAHRTEAFSFHELFSGPACYQDQDDPKVFGQVMRLSVTRAGEPFA